MSSVGGRDDRADWSVAVVDADQRPVLWLQVVTEDLPDGRRPKTDPQRVAAPFTMVVSPNQVWLFNGAAEATARFATPPIVARYQPNGPPRVGSRRLMTVLEAWLTDLALGWTELPPPGLEAVEAAGLLDRLRQETWHVAPDELGFRP